MWLNMLLTYFNTPSFHCVFSPFTCSNKSCSTLRICLTTTRSASPLHSVWPRTSWTFPTAGVIFYLGIWESIAFSRSTVPCPETQRALQGPTRRSRVTKSFTGPCTSQQQRGWQVREQQEVTAEQCVCIQTGMNHPPVIHWEPALFIYSSVFH